jgi:hypothetical protein
MTSFHPRLHVLLARDAPVGLILRRGPSKSVATIGWDRRRDEFQLGQWLRGRIYERRCDLSPDGKYFIYFAANGRWNSESKGSWSAISRAPYLKAIAFFPKGDCWHGGGLWTGKREYWLNGGDSHEILRDSTEVSRARAYRPEKNYGGECPGVYYPRLARDGWNLVRYEEKGRWAERHYFEKPAGNGWMLRKTAHSRLEHPPGEGCYADGHELIREGSEEVLSFPRWEWADVDGKRIVWTEKGKLFAAKLARHGLKDEIELWDGNALKFAPLEAPY